MERLKQRAKLDLSHVPYKGTPPAVTDPIGGQVDLLFTSIAGPIEQVRAGRLRLLAADEAGSIARLVKDEGIRAE